MTRNKRDATASLLGYTYQRYVAIYKLISKIGKMNHQNLFIKEENYEDVDIITKNTNGDIINVNAYQIKYTSVSESLTESGGFLKVIISNLYKNINNITFIVGKKEKSKECYTKNLKSFKERIEKKNYNEILFQICEISSKNIELNGNKNTKPNEGKNTELNEDGDTELNEDEDTELNEDEETKNRIDRCDKYLKILSIKKLKFKITELKNKKNIKNIKKTIKKIGGEISKIEKEIDELKNKKYNSKVIDKIDNEINNLTRQEIEHEKLNFYNWLIVNLVFMKTNETTTQNFKEYIAKFRFKEYPCLEKTKENIRKKINEVFKTEIKKIKDNVENEENKIEMIVQSVVIDEIINTLDTNIAKKIEVSFTLLVNSIKNKISDIEEFVNIDILTALWGRNSLNVSKSINLTLEWLKYLTTSNKQFDLSYDTVEQKIIENTIDNEMERKKFFSKLKSFLGLEEWDMDPQYFHFMKNYKIYKGVHKGVTGEKLKITFEEKIKRNN